MFPAYRSAHGRGATFSRLVCCLALFLLAFAWPGGLTPPAAAQEMNLLYSENFDDGRADGWSLPDNVEGAWWVEGGQLIGSGQNVFAELPGPEWGAGQHQLEFDLGGLGVNNGLHVNVQHSDTGRYMVGFRQVDDRQLYIYLERNLWGQPSQPLSSNANDLFEYRDFETYHVRIDFGDGQLSVYLNKPGNPGSDFPDVSAFDSQPLPPGWLSLESLMNMPVRVDNLVVYGPGLPLVFSPFPEPPFIPGPEEPEQPEPEPEQPQVTEQPGEPEPPPPSAAVPEFRQCQGESLLYAEAFEDGQAQDWNLQPGWSVGDGLMEGRGHKWADYPANWEDLTLYVVYSLPVGGDGLHVCTRKSDTGRYFVGVSTQGLGLQKQVGWGQGEQFIPLTGTGLQTDPDIWHTLAFAVHGRSIQVALDGNVQLEAQDKDPLPAGSIALETLDDRGAVIEEVWVCGTPPEQPPETEAPAPPATEPPAPPPDDKPNPPSPQALPDLVVADIQAQTYDAAARTQTLLVSVANVGDLTAGANQVRIQIPGGQALYYNIPKLDPYKSTTLLAQLKIPAELTGSSRRIEARIDPNNRIREQDELNNTRLSAAIEFAAPSGPCWPCIILVAVGVLVVLLIGRSIWRRLRRGRASERPQKEPQGLPPVLPPVHLLDVWLTEGGSGKGARLKDDRPLVAGAEYCLHAQVLSHEAQPKARAQATGAPLALHAVVFSPETDFSVRERRLGLELPPGGSSQPVFWPFRAGQPGQRRARVCLYYGNLLLQSATVDAAVVVPEGAGRAPASDALRRRLDYVTSASLSGLERLPQPAVSIFTNQSPGGMGWIGVYAGGEPTSSLSGGLLRLVDPERLRWRAKPARQRLLEIEEAYTFAQQTPAGRFSRLEQDLALLACSGWSLYDELFLRSPRVSRQELACFDQTLRPPGLVAIDRCRSENVTLPWAAIYDLEVDTGKQDQLSLCPVFKAELQAHWSPDMAQYDPHHDWLDNPQGCRQNPRCPLASDNEQITLLTVCPFGFWGFRHQISQPLQAVTPTPVGQIPQEIAQAGEYQGVSSFDSTIYLRREQNERLKLAVGVHPGLAQAERLPVDITALRPNELEVTYESARDRVLELLKQGGFHFYILYCHGDCDEREQKFKLVFGPLQDERPISCENLNPLKISWPEQPKPLVLLNGCETVAVTPEIVHGLLDRLHELGAAGVVGTEIQVYPSLAYPFGLEILERLLCGASLGEAFLEERKELLRQLNPLGLAYTYYAPAALHVHVEGACGWCAAHKVLPR